MADKPKSDITKPKYQIGKTAQLYTGVDLMGSKTSLQHKESEMLLTVFGLKCTSKKNKRIILIPWSNVKGVELFPDSEDSE